MPYASIRRQAHRTKIGTTSYAATVIWGKTKAENIHLKTHMAELIGPVGMGTLGPHGWNVRVIDFTKEFIKVREGSA